MMRSIALASLLTLCIVDAHAANRISKMISELPDQKQPPLWKALLKTDACDQVVRTMYQGTSKKADIWSVGCKNGKDYSLAIFDDAVGSTKVLTCKELAAIEAASNKGKMRTKTGCWVTY